SKLSPGFAFGSAPDRSKPQGPYCGPNCGAPAGCAAAGAERPQRIASVVAKAGWMNSLFFSIILENGSISLKDSTAMARRRGKSVDIGSGRLAECDCA